MATQYQTGAQLSFGDTTVVPGRRELTHSGRRVAIGDRAFDLLLLLLERRGTVVSKGEIMEAVWPQRMIGENTLESQMSDLRRALGNDRDAIRTVSGRGYQFVGILDPALQATGSQTNVVKSLPPRPQSVNVPANVSPLIGRNLELEAVIALIQSQRLVTLIGAAGIGKTRLAIEAARRVATRFSDGVFLAELSATSSAEQLPAVVAAALGFPPENGTRSREKIAPALRGKRFLLLMDNCEHLVESAARVADALLRVAPASSVLATSREALRIPGECIYRVPSLGIPVEDDDTDSFSYGAVQLLKERITENLYAEGDRTSTAAMVRICRRLDGIPLAIELAAACTSAFGLVEVAERLDDRFRLLRHGARTAPLRHQTLRSAIDWSYDPLPRKSQIVLNRLGAFMGNFSLESAQKVACCVQISPQDVTSAVIELVNKSLVCAIPGVPQAMYRLLDTIRAYALERLQESDAWRE